MAYTAVPDGMYLDDYSDEEGGLDFGDSYISSKEAFEHAQSGDGYDQFVPTLSSITTNSTPQDTKRGHSQYEDAEHETNSSHTENDNYTPETDTPFGGETSTNKTDSNAPISTKSPMKGVLRDSRSSSGSPSPNKKPVVFNIESEGMHIQGTATDQSNRGVFSEMRHERRGFGFGGFKTRSPRNRRRHVSGGHSRTHPYVAADGGTKNDHLKIVEMGEELRVAIARGKTEEIQRILDSGFDVDNVLKSGWTALMHACDCANDTAVEMLLTRGANPNTQRDMYTALMAVCAAGRTTSSEPHVDCARLLVNKGARVNVHDKHHMSPLLYACQTGQSCLAELLISVNADINKQDSRGWTPLMYAAEKCDLHLIKILIKANADPQIASNLGDTPSTIAYGNGYTDISDYLDGVMSGSLEVSDEGALHKVPPHPVLVEFSQDDATTKTRDDLCPNPPMTSSSNGPTRSSESVHYGDLELFLLGQKLGDLVPLFQRHKVAFGDLISMTDRDLEQIGVHQVGARKNILTAIAELHSKEWSMPADHLPIDKPISALEAAVILSHVSSHASYIKGTVSYLLNHVRSYPDMLGVHLVSTETEQVTNELSSAVTSVSSLQNEMTTLHSEVTTALSVHSQTDQSAESSHGMVTRRRALKLVAVIGGLTLVSIAAVYVSKSLIRRFNTS